MMIDLNFNPNRMNIHDIVKYRLCTQCGACAAACPHNAIKIERNRDWCFYPRVVDTFHCRNGCRKFCLASCAGIHEDTTLWTKHPIEFANYHEFCIGRIRSAWVGHATDPGIHHRGASGGIVVGLLVYLLETQRIDGALIVGPNSSAPLTHDIKIARTRAEIEASWGSKYYPLPIGTHFSDLAVSEQRFAVVLLGCQMRSLRLFERSLPILQESILIHIGLICGYCAGFKALVDQALEWGIKDLMMIRQIDFREGTWPGNVRIQTPNSDHRTIIYNFLLRIPFTTNMRCLTCSDLMNETADVTIGDAWLPHLTARCDEGWSVVASRTSEAEMLIIDAQREGALHLEPIDRKMFMYSQAKPLRYKKDALITRRNMVKHLLRKGVPDFAFHKYHYGFQTNLWNRLGNRLLVLTAWIFFRRDQLRRCVFRIVPRPLIRWYVRTLFLMIAHDGKGSFVIKWLLDREPVLNCDA